MTSCLKDYSDEDKWKKSSHELFLLIFIIHNLKNEACELQTETLFKFINET